MAGPGDFATIFQRETILSWQEFSSIDLEIGATPKLFPSRIVPNWEGIREVNIFLPELFPLKMYSFPLRYFMGVAGVAKVLCILW